MKMIVVYPNNEVYIDGDFVPFDMTDLGKMGIPKNRPSNRPSVVENGKLYVSGDIKIQVFPTNSCITGLKALRKKRKNVANL